MSKKVKEELTTALFLSALLILALVATVFYEKTHPEFDEKISGKEATVVSEVAKIYYDAPFGGRSIGTVTKSQKVELTGRMEYQLQNDDVRMEIRLEDGSSAWISKKDIAIPE